MWRNFVRVGEGVLDGFILSIFPIAMLVFQVVQWFGSFPCCRVFGPKGGVIVSWVMWQ